jgi:hypothetical protein
LAALLDEAGAGLVECLKALEPFAACAEQIDDKEDGEEWAKFQAADQALPLGGGDLPQAAPKDDNPRRGTSTGAARLGAALADLAEKHRQPGDPDPCSSCGLKKGTLANMAGRTMIDAMNVLAGIDGDLFGCHHGMREGQPVKACINWHIAAERASRDELLAAIQTVRMPADDAPERTILSASMSPSGRLRLILIGRWTPTNLLGSGRSRNPHHINMKEKVDG